MTEPILIRRTVLIALATAVQTLTPAIVAVASLLVVMRFWGVSLQSHPATFVVFVAVTFIVLFRPPSDVSTQMAVLPFPMAAAVLIRWFLLVIIIAVIGYATHSLAMLPTVVSVVWVLLTPLLLFAAAMFMHRMMRRIVMMASAHRRVIIAGYNETSLELYRRLRGNPVLRLNVEGFFDDRGADRLDMSPGAKLIGRLSAIAEHVKQNQTDVIFIALPVRHVKRVLDLLDELRDTTASIYYVPDIFVFDLIQARSGELNGIPVVAMCETPFQGYRGVTKRLFDVFVSAGALLIASPLFLLVALAVRLSSPGPVIFRQRRYGLDGQEIIVYKFRTMSVTEDGPEIRQASRTDSRVTRLGAILRRTSLDELPQLINVLQGRMSLVGPRPHAVAHNEMYRKLIKGYMVRHKVLPGITGLAQVSGCRGETSSVEAMEARVKYDIDYLRHWSLTLDLKILLLTAVKVVWDDSAY
jgi:putative colanic acid biosynthesis UDP-glucose lipid carrier transferase